MSKFIKSPHPPLTRGEQSKSPCERGFRGLKSPLVKRDLGDSPTLIACSGGMDSVCLLYMMADMFKKDDIRLGACYVDHKLRESAKNESHFVDKICQSLGVEFYHAEFTDDFWNDSLSNFEKKARNERYRLLFECAETNGFEQIATAHHLDDQVETVLMRIFDRGTGLKGLAGIKRSHHSHIKIIRPLLHLTRKDIEKFMDGREFMIDESNNDTNIRRNFYRLNVIPAITSVLKSEEFKHHISRLSDNAARETEFCEILADQFFDNFCHDSDNFEIKREIIEKYNNGFWLTAFSYFFARHRIYSHSFEALNDLVLFIRKKEPAEADYHPFIFKRDRNRVLIVRITDC